MPSVFPVPDLRTGSSGFGSFGHVAVADNAWKGVLDVILGLVLSVNSDFDIAKSRKKHTGKIELGVGNLQKPHLGWDELLGLDRFIRRPCRFGVK